MDHRLKKDKQFTYIYRRGKKVNTEHLTLFSVASKFKTYKIGYVVSKKIGKANQRNKLKRRMKEIVRTNTYAKDFNNYILLAKQGILDLGFEALKEEIKKVFEKWNISYILSKYCCVYLFIFTSGQSPRFYQMCANLLHRVQIILSKQWKNLGLLKVFY